MQYNFDLGWVELSFKPNMADINYTVMVENGFIEFIGTVSFKLIDIAIFIDSIERLKQPLIRDII